MQKRKFKFGQEYPYVYLVPRSLGSCRKALQDFRYMPDGKEKVRVDMDFLEEGRYRFFVFHPYQQPTEIKGMAFIKGELESWGESATQVKFKMYRKDVVRLAMIVGTFVGCLGLCSLIGEGVRLFMTVILFTSWLWLLIIGLEVKFWLSRRRVATMIKDALFNAPQMPESVSYPSSREIQS